MRSASNSPASLSQHLHSGEEVGKSGQGNAVSFHANSTSKSGQATTVQLNSTTQATTPNNLPLKGQVSVEPMQMSPCPVTKSNGIISMDTQCHEGRRIGSGPQTGSTLSQKTVCLANGRPKVLLKYQMPFGNEPAVKCSHFAASVPVYSPF